MTIGTLEHSSWPFDNIKNLLFVINAVHELFYSVFFKIYLSIILESQSWYLNQIDVILAYKLLQRGNEVADSSPLGDILTLESQEFFSVILEHSFFNHERELVIESWVIHDWWSLLGLTSLNKVILHLIMIWIKQSNSLVGLLEWISHLAQVSLWRGLTSQLTWRGCLVSARFILLWWNISSSRVLVGTWVSCVDVSHLAIWLLWRTRFKVIDVHSCQESVITLSNSCVLTLWNHVLSLVLDLVWHNPMSQLWRLLDLFLSHVWLWIWERCISSFKSRG